MMMRIIGGLTAVCLVLVALTIAAAQSGDKSTNSNTKSSSHVAHQLAVEATDIDSKWLLKLSDEDRKPLEELIGFAPPAYANDLEWISDNQITWDELRGNVVVLQSWNSATTVGRKWISRVDRALDGFDSNDVITIALHTPQGADKAAKYIENQPLPSGITAVVDSGGGYCDELGIYREPVNIVVDRQGAVRYVGLNEYGLQQAVSELIAEGFDPDKKVAQLPQAEHPAVEFPPIQGGIRSAKDVRGQRAPEFFVQEWLTAEPNAKDKVVILDFWATWCGPCVRSIPHMNNLAKQFKDDALCVGISDENNERFMSGLKRRRMSMESFDYPLALDPGRKMYRQLQIRGIPHTIIMSSDWVVRWQGNPLVLRPEVVEQIIEADRASQCADQTTSLLPRRGWTAG